MPALVAVMIMVSIGTFSWNSIANLRRHPPTSSAVMIATVVVVVATHDLSLGVLTGVLLSGVFFAGKVRRMFAVERSEEHTSELQSLMRISYAVFGLKKKKHSRKTNRPLK